MKNKIIQLSPNSLNLFLECPRCFWFDKKWNIKRPSSYPYTLNTAVDILLKKEFDNYRSKNKTHPLLKENNISARLFSNQNLLDEWRSNSKGIHYFDLKNKAFLFGAVDDILEFSNNKLAPLDYKSTGNKVLNIYDRFQLQMDVYTFLLEKNNYKTPRKGYLAFYIVDKENGFQDKLPFRKELYEIETNPSDIHKLFKSAVGVLKKDIPPKSSLDCSFCRWKKKISNFDLPKK